MKTAGRRVSSNLIDNRNPTPDPFLKALSAITPSMPQPAIRVNPLTPEDKDRIIRNIEKMMREKGIPRTTPKGDSVRPKGDRVQFPVWRVLD